jgi:hypothetical protein
VRNLPSKLNPNIYDESSEEETRRKNKSELSMPEDDVEPLKTRKPKKVTYQDESAT